MLNKIILNMNNDIDIPYDYCNNILKLMHDIFKQYRHDNKIIRLLKLYLSADGELICIDLINKYCRKNNGKFLDLILSIENNHDSLDLFKCVNKICFKYYYYNYYEILCSNCYDTVDDFYYIMLLSACKSGFIDVIKDLISIYENDNNISTISSKYIIKAFNISLNRYIKKILYKACLNDKKVSKILINELENKNDIQYILNIKTYSQKYSDIIIKIYNS